MKPSLRTAWLTRHAGANPALDELRRAALPPPRLSPFAFLRELFLPARTAWCTLALLWLVIAALHLASPSAPSAQRGTAFAEAALFPTSLSQLNAFLNENRAHH